MQVIIKYNNLFKNSIFEQRRGSLVPKGLGTRLVEIITLPDSPELILKVQSTCSIELIPVIYNN